MEIDRLSASAMQVLEACPSRFQANQAAGRIGQESGYAAMVGTSCHYALEHFVLTTVMTAEYAQTWETLEIFLQHGYQQTFHTTDWKSKSYKECLELVKRWFERNADHWDEFKVISAEKKLNFPVQTSQGERPFNYIFDRLDQLDETVFRVVDYKTLGRPLSPADLHDKLQPRTYGLAVQIMYPQATRVWVEFDMLRWEGPIATAYTREQNIETYRRIQRAFELGYGIPADDPKHPVPELLNDECGFCVKKTTCKAVQANINAGGFMNFGDLGEVVQLRARLKNQAKAAADAAAELDAVLLKHAERTGELVMTGGAIEAKVSMRSTRSVDASKVANLVPTDLFHKYGGLAINMKDFDDLLKDPALDGSVRADLEQLITKSYSDPFVTTKEKRK